MTIFAFRSHESKSFLGMPGGPGCSSELAVFYGKTEQSVWDNLLHSEMEFVDSWGCTIRGLMTCLTLSLCMQRMVPLGSGEYHLLNVAAWSLLSILDSCLLRFPKVHLILSILGPIACRENLTLSENEYGWDKEANIIFVDQPLSVGFSVLDVSMLSCNGPLLAPFAC